MTDPPPVQQIAAGVLIQGEALPLMYRAAIALIARQHRDGLAASTLLHEARTAFYRATSVSQARHQVGDHAPAESCCTCQDGDLIDTGAAANLLGLSRRQVQRLAADPWGGVGGVRVGGTWALDRGAVLALATARERKAAR